jgi:antitoxin PrlF
VDVSATVTAKGQVTIPKQVRDQLGLRDGDRVLFRVVDGRAVLARTADLLDLAGVVPVPADARDLSWEQIRESAHRSQAARSA